jgi:putative ABC transport system permease protein
VVGELATTLVLLTAAGLLTKSFARVTSIDTGIEPASVLTGTVQLAFSRYRGEAAAVFFDRLVTRVAALPDVQAVAISDAMPLRGTRSSLTFTLNGKKTPMVDLSAVSDGYFHTLGIPVLSGRAFTASDRRGSTAVAVINQTMARTLFAGQNAVGQTISLDEDQAVQIVGVAGDVLQRGIEAQVRPLIYRPLAQEGAATYMQLLVRSARTPESLIPSIRDAFHSIDPSQPAPAFASMEQVMSETVASRRFSFVLLGIFAGIAGLLAAIGLYGVMSYLVAERTSEIGIRVALGADRSRVLRLVLGEGMVLAMLGIVLGLAGSAAGVRTLRTMLFKVSIYDPWIFASCAVILAAIAIAACALPALRAARVDPMLALRSD